MDFEEFWDRTKKFLEKEVELETVTKASFRTYFDKDAGVVVVVPLSTNLPRDINKGDFKNVYLKMKELRRRHDNVLRPAFYQRLTRNSSYILPIINGVQTHWGNQKTLDTSKDVTS